MYAAAGQFNSPLYPLDRFGALNRLGNRTVTCGLLIAARKVLDYIAYRLNADPYQQAGPAWADPFEKLHRRIQ